MNVIPAEVAHSLAEALCSVATEASILAREMELRPPGAVLHVWSTRQDLRPHSAAAVVRDFRRRGWLSGGGDGSALYTTGAAPVGLSAFLGGVAVMAAIRPEAGTFQAVVTPPPNPSAFAKALQSTGMARADLMDTASAMRQVASAAHRDLVMLTPFANEQGLSFVADLFEISPATNRTLILRARNSGTRRALEGIKDRLRDLRVRVLDYVLDLGDGNYETFHAKVVLADEQMAYVGSANMLHYARNSMELGVLLRGRGTDVIAAAVRAAERCAIELQSVSPDVHI